MGEFMNGNEKTKNTNVLEAKIYKLQRFVHKWTNTKKSIVFYTIPMLHIGDRSYYGSINMIIDDLNHVLLEGVNLKLKNNDFGKYSILAKKADLETQLNVLRINNDIKKINIDIDNKLINKKIKQMPLLEKIELRMFNIRMKRIKRKNDLKELLKKYYSYSQSDHYKMIDPRNHYYFKNREKDYFQLIVENDRDEILRQNLSEYMDSYEANDYRIDTGILVGDAHMPAIYRLLEEKDYKWQLYETLTVIE